MNSRAAMVVGAVVLATAMVGTVVWVTAQEGGRPQSAQSVSPDGIRLGLSVGDSIVRPGEPIDLRTTLEYVGTGDRVIYDATGGGPVLQTVRYLDGDGIARQIGWNLDCFAYELARGEVQEQPLHLWATIDRAEPDGAFGRELLSHPDLRLPFGRWAIDAVMRYYPGRGCDGPETWIQATVIVMVEGEPWPTEAPAPS